MKLEELKTEGFLLERASGAVYLAESDVICAEDFEQDGSVIKQQKLVSKEQAKQVLDDVSQLDVKGYKVLRQSGKIYYEYSLNIDAPEYENEGGIVSYVPLVPYYQIKHILENTVPAKKELSQVERIKLRL